MKDLIYITKYYSLFKEMNNKDGWLYLTKSNHTVFFHKSWYEKPSKFMEIDTDLKQGFYHWLLKNLKNNL